MKRLKIKCMRAKEILSKDLNTIILENIINNKAICVTITNRQLEN